MPGLQHSPAWGVRGEWIYFHSGANTLHHDIWRYSVNKNTAEQVTGGELYHFGVAISPAGQLAYSSNKTGNYEIWLQDKDRNQQITDHPGNDGSPSWHPKKNELIFESSRSGYPNIWNIDLNTKIKTQLTNHEYGARLPVWNPRY